MGYIGIDLAKETCVATVITKTGRVKKRFDFPNSKTGFAALEAIAKPRDELVIEAGTYAYPIHDHFRERGIKVHVAHPRGVRQITESDKKTDQHDSEVLAQLARVGYLPLAYIPHPEILRNRELLRARLDLAYRSTKTKTKIRAFLDKQGAEVPANLFEEEGIKWLKAPGKWGDSRDTVLALMVEELDHIQHQRASIDPVLVDLARESDQTKLLMSIPGLDYYLALVVIAEVGDVTRFKTKEAFRSYAGCAPRMRESAGKNRASGTNRSKSPRLKTAISLAAQTAARYKNPIKDAFDHRMAKTGMASRAHAVARRKMCDLIYTLLVTGESCRWANPASVERKLARLDKSPSRGREPPTPP